MARQKGGRGVRRKGLPRTSRGMSERTTILLVGEGQATEPNYFAALAKLDEVRRRFTIHVRPGPGHNPEAVLETAIKFRDRASSRGEEYDEVWCVLDTESGEEKRKSLDKAVVEASRTGIGICLSNPAFEVWFLSHFERTTRSFLHCDAVLEHLNRHWREAFSRDYEKGDTKHFFRLQSRMPNGLSNAEWVREASNHKDTPNTADCNSSTEVYRLVKRFLDG